MNQRITRRRFGQLALASTAVASGVVGIADFANKTSAQTTPSLVYGLLSGSLTTSNTPSPAGASEVSSSTASNTTVSIPVGLILQSFDLATSQIQTVKTLQFLGDGTTPILQSNETVGGFTALANGTFIITITPVSGSQNESNPTRLIILSASPVAVTLSGLSQQEKLDSLVSTTDGGLLGLVVQKNSTSPVRLVDINLQTGQITTSSKVTLPNNQRFSVLTQCPDGTLYTTTTDLQGNTQLVKLDQNQKTPITLLQLSLNGKTWNNGLQSLVCSAGGQLIAFGALRYVTPNRLYTVNTSDGTLTGLSQFNVPKITTVPTKSQLS